MFPGWWQILIVAVLVFLLFGRGRISELMGDVAKGITSFRKGLKEDSEEAAPAKAVSDQSADAASMKSESTTKAEAKAKAE